MKTGTEFEIKVTVSFMGESRVFTGSTFTKAWEQGQIWKQDAMHSYARSLEKVSFLNLKAHKEARNLPAFLATLTGQELDMAADEMVRYSPAAHALGKDEIIRRFKVQAATVAA